MDAQSSSATLTARGGPPGTAESTRGNLRAADWLCRSKTASLPWLVARLWLGCEWLNAGYQKLWGSENAASWNGGGARGQRVCGRGSCRV